MDQLELVFPVASASPIHVFPIQRVLKHCGAHKYLRTPQLVGFARWGVKRHA